MTRVSKAARTGRKARLDSRRVRQPGERHLSGVSKLLLALATLILFGFATPVVKADLVTIAFEPTPTEFEFAPGLFSPTSYRSQGVVIFTGNSSIMPGRLDAIFTGFGIGPHPSSISPPNIAFGSDGRPLSQPLFHDLVARFFDPGVLLPGTTDYVSFNIVSRRPGQMDPWMVAIFGAGGSIFDEVNMRRLEVMTGTGDGFVSFTRPGFDIAGFVLFASSRREGVDNLSFNTPQVPEPTTMLLLGTGLAGVAVRVRRQRKQ